MLYLALQTFLLLALTAAAFFALGYYFHQRFVRARIVVSEQPPASPPPAKTDEETVAMIRDLRSRLLEKERDIAALLETVAAPATDEPAPPVAPEAASATQTQPAAAVSAELETLREAYDAQVRANAGLQETVQEWEKRFRSLEQMRVAQPDEVMQEKLESLSTEITLKNGRIEEFQEEVEALQAALRLAEEQTQALARALGEAEAAALPMPEAAPSADVEAMKARIVQLETQLNEREYLLQMTRNKQDQEREELEEAAEAIWEEVKVEAAEEEDTWSAPHPKPVAAPTAAPMPDLKAPLEALVNKIQKLESTIDSLREENEVALSTALKIARTAKVEAATAPPAPVVVPVSVVAPAPADLWAAPQATPLRVVEPPPDSVSERDALVAALWKEEKDAEKDRLRRSVESLRSMLDQKEKAIADLGSQVEDLAGKLDPLLVGPDNLQLIKGIGPFTRKMLDKEFGIRTYEQLAKLTREDLDRISEKLFFQGKIEREDWLGQALALFRKKYNQDLEIENPPYPFG